MFKITISLFLLFLSSLRAFNSHSIPLNITQDIKSCNGLERLIAYTVRSENGLDIWTVNPLDLSTRNLTNGNSQNLNPSWSHDGSKLAFKTYRDGNWEIYVIDANGTNLINLSNDPSDDEYPKWSPDGSKIAFISNRGGNEDIYVMNSDGTNVVNISNDVGDSIMPVWSPTSESLAYLSGDNDLRQIEIHDLKQGTATNYQNTSHVNFMSWSRNGNFIAFSSFIDSNSGASEIYVLDVQRRLIIKMTATQDTNLQPYWSPVGEFVLYWGITKDILGPSGTSIHMIRTDDGTDRILPQNSPNDSGGIWSPDGKYIAFYSGQDHTSLYMMDSDGSNPQQLVSSVQDSSLAWQPCLITN